MLAAQVAANAQRLNDIDSTGTRGVLVVQTQLADLKGDVVSGFAETKIWQGRHEQEHRDEAKSRTNTRRWAWGLGVAALAALESPLLVLIAHLH